MNCRKTIRTAGEPRSHRDDTKRSSLRCAPRSVGNSAQPYPRECSVREITPLCDLGTCAGTYANARHCCGNLRTRAECASTSHKFCSRWSRIKTRLPCPGCAVSGCLFPFCLRVLETRAWNTISPRNEFLGEKFIVVHS